METYTRQHRALLQKIARRVMLERGLLPDFSSEVLAELDGIQGGLPQRPQALCATCAVCCGVPLTTMIRAIWTSYWLEGLSGNLQLQDRCLRG